MISALLYAGIFFLSLTGKVRGAAYSLSSSNTGGDFLRSFHVDNRPDPSHGRVNYVDAATAARENLTYASGDHFILRADFKKVLDPNGPGRNSVRLKSNKQYSTSVLIFDLRHMPQGCGTWPAVWTVASTWPGGGEIDIIEGINNQGPNAATLHTGPGCKMPSSRSQTGTPVLNDCNSLVNYNIGCGVKFNDWRSFGPSFNNNGGGWYAMERTESHIKIWFWTRDAGNVPSDVRNGAPSVDPNSWGVPVAYFPNNMCPIGQRFGLHNIMINLTFCGDWAGTQYGVSGCPASCVDYVNKNPTAFTDAYFDFAWLNVYE